MAIVNATKTGNWSDATVWPASTYPVAGDQVQANGFTVTINQNITVSSIRTTAEGGGSAGGGFTANNGVVITADVVAGTTVCLQHATNASVTVVGNIVGGGNNAIGFYANGTATTTITGAITGGAGTSAYGFQNASTGTVNITGNVTGAASHGINLNGAGTINITGDVTGGSVAAIYGISNTALAIVNIIGNVVGGSLSGAATAYGVHNGSTGTINITGNCIPGLQSAGLYNASSGVVAVTGKVFGNDWKQGDAGAGTPGIVAVAASSTLRVVTVNSLAYGAYGQPPTSGPVHLAVTSSSIVEFYTSAGVKRTFYLADSAELGFPAESDVRSTTTFDGGTKQGTCAVPPAASVAYGVPVDATIGTAQLTQLTAQQVWEYATRTITSGGITVAEIWDALLAGIVTSDSIGKLIKDYLDVAVSTRASTGAGAIPWVYTLTDSVTGAPIYGAEVWVSTDSAGANIIASGATDVYGVVNFMLDAGQIYIWRKKAGYNFSDPDAETVT